MKATCLRLRYTQLLAQGNRNLARRLYRATQNGAHFTQCIDLERKLKKTDRRYAVRLNRYGLSVGELSDEIDRLLKWRISLQRALKSTTASFQNAEFFSRPSLEALRPLTSGFNIHHEILQNLLHQENLGPED